MKLIEQDYADVLLAAQALADKLADVLRDAIENRGKALIAVSGGRTPQHVFNHLKQQDVDWSRVTVSLTDERWVPVNHPDSNESLVRQHLLTGPASAATFAPLFGGEATPMAGQNACEDRLNKQSLPFDAVYLGMGGDGHFASLFPHTESLHVATGNCTPVPEIETRSARMSLTLPTILAARHIFLLFSGAEKHQKYQEAQELGSTDALPLRLLLNQTQKSIHVLTAP